MLELKVKLLTDTAKPPTKAHDSDAGWDLYSDEDVFIRVDEPKIVKTNIAIGIPKGYCAVIKDRSGFGSKGIEVLCGVIDESYIGPVGIVFYNLSNEENYINDGYYRVDDGRNSLSKSGKYIKKGDKVAQMLILPVPKVKVVVVDELDDTERGEKGFGSSGQ